MLIAVEVSLLLDPFGRQLGHICMILMHIYIHTYICICPYINISIFILVLLDILITE